MSYQSTALFILFTLVLLHGEHRVVSVRAPKRAKVAGHVPVKVHLIHRDSPLSPLYEAKMTRIERLKKLVERSSHRLQRLSMAAHDGEHSAKAASYQTEVIAGDGEFLMKMGIGSPPMDYMSILDTGSDLTWTQCQPCSNCYDQPTPIYDPNKSSTFSRSDCNSELCKALPTYQCSRRSECAYQYEYGDYSTTSGVLAYETFTLGESKLEKIAFGCGRDNEGGGFGQGSGLSGFGRGPLSLVSQLGKSGAFRFSYCLTSYDERNATSPLFLGAKQAIIKNAVETPLIKNNMRETFYYLELEGISIGSSLVNIPGGVFDVRPDGTGGLIIDSGTTITYLEEAGYNAVKKELVSAIKLPPASGAGIGLDQCFTANGTGADKVTFPTLTLSFGGRANMVLPPENYLIADGNGLICFAMLPSNGLSILGNVQQQNFAILYDGSANRLSFAPAKCSAL